MISKLSFSSGSTNHHTYLSNKDPIYKYVIKSKQDILQGFAVYFQQEQNITVLYKILEIYIKQDLLSSTFKMNNTNILKREKASISRFFNYLFLKKTIKRQP